MHRWGRGDAKTKAFPGDNLSSINLRTEEMNVFGLSNSDHLRCLNHLRDSGMANSPGVSQPFHYHPIELGPPNAGRAELWLSAGEKSSPLGENKYSGYEPLQLKT